MGEVSLSCCVEVLLAANVLENGFIMLCCLFNYAKIVGFVDLNEIINYCNCILYLTL